MLVVPFLLACGKSFTLIRWWRRISDLGDKICRGCFRNTIDEDTKQGNSEEYVETNTKPEEKTFPIVKPVLLLLFRKSNPRKVRLELETGQKRRAHATPSIDMQGGCRRKRTNSLIKLLEEK